MEGGWGWGGFASQDMFQFGWARMVDGKSGSWSWDHGLVADTPLPDEQRMEDEMFVDEG